MLPARPEETGGPSPLSVWYRDWQEDESFRGIIPIISSGMPASREAEEALANVDIMLRAALGDSGLNGLHLLAHGPDWEKLPCQSKGNSVARGSRTDFFIARICHVTVRTLLRIRRRKADNDLRDPLPPGPRRGRSCENSERAMGEDVDLDDAGVANNPVPHGPVMDLCAAASSPSVKENMSAALIVGRLALKTLVCNFPEIRFVDLVTTAHLSGSVVGHKHHDRKSRCN